MENKSDFNPHSNLLETGDLISRIRAGEGQAQSELFDRYSYRLNAFMRARLPVAARGLMETQDLVQEVCIRVVPSLEQFDYRGIGSFWAYLRRIALNYVHEVWRKFATRQVQEPLLQESWCAPEAQDSPPLTGLIQKEQFQSFEHALEKLEERKRQALLMRLELGLQYRIIAEECGYSSEDAVRKDIHRNLDRVAMEMESHAD